MAVSFNLVMVGLNCCTSKMTMNLCMKLVLKDFN